MCIALRNGLLTLAALAASAWGAEHVRDKRTQNHLELEQAWFRFANHGGNDQQARDLLLAGGETSLEILLDLLFGPADADAQDADIAAWINELGNPLFEVREAAMARLRASGTAAIGALYSATSMSDPETRYRVRALIKQYERRTNAAGRETLLRPTTMILESHWPLEQLQAVAARHLDRLMGVHDVAYSSEARPLAPLLASLRYSADAQQRELLSRVASKGAEGAAFVALSVMRGGLAGRDSRAVAEHWQRLPPHDYDAVALGCLDQARPRVFRQAMHAATPGPTLIDRLHKALPSIKDEKLQRDVYAFLWHQFGDAKSRDFFVAELAAERDADFRAAVYQLTNKRLAENAEAIVPQLAAAVLKSSWDRQRFILARMELFQEEQPARLAAAGIASLLSSDAQQARSAAGATLLKLHDRAGVLKDLARLDDPSIRSEAAKLLGQWKAQQLSRAAERDR